MARSIRIEFPGAFYHVMARGNRSGKVFRDDADREFFLQTLGKACAMTGWRVHAWVLMSNHYHFFMETPEANLVAGMKWLQNAYTCRFNTRHQQWGRLFADRYKSVLVEGADCYYETLLDYIHLNPARAGLVRPKSQSVLDYPWSSVAGGYALTPAQRPPWLAASDGLAMFDCADTASGRRRWVERLDRRAREEPRDHCGVPAPAEHQDARRSDIRRGWYWGSLAFAGRMRKLAGSDLKQKRRRSRGTSAESPAHGEREARRLLAEGLAVSGLTPEQVRELPGSEPRKVAIARVIWEGTTMSLGWITEHLAMRGAANVSQQIRLHCLHPPRLPKALEKWTALARTVA